MTTAPLPTSGRRTHAGHSRHTAGIRAGLVQTVCPEAGTSSAPADEEVGTSPETARHGCKAGPTSWRRSR